MKTISGAVFALTAVGLASSSFCGGAVLGAGAGSQRTPTTDAKPGLAVPSEAPGNSQVAGNCSAGESPQIHVDSGHPWRAPFGVERVGAHPVAHVEWRTEVKPAGAYALVTFRNGREAQRYRLDPQQDPPAGQQPKTRSRSYFANATLAEIPHEIAVLVQCSPKGKFETVARQSVRWPSFEADAQARPKRRINPVDLWTILVPHDQLLLVAGQRAIVDVAVLSHARDIPHARLHVAFTGAAALEVPFAVVKGQRKTTALEVPLTASGSSTVLTVSLQDADQTIWRKEIRTLLVAKAPEWPAFGAVETKLRYDEPIVVKDPESGKPLPAIDYDSAWKSALSDVIVFLPNGSRFVFWRGASYIPFWATAYNTGLSYQWAENLSHRVPHPDGTIDFREPMFDSELRYNRVRVVESTNSRVHVRWSYQLTSLDYSLLSDQATEDFYFYPDGFGTRVITLSSLPGDRFQLTEFIVLTSQSTYPLESLPERMARLLYMDGASREIHFPFEPDDKGQQRRYSKPVTAGPERDAQPKMVRIWSHKDDPASAIYFDPHEVTAPYVLGPFYDRGEVVTPAYWHNHWPLTRGSWTGWEINDQVNATPAASSVLTLGFDAPTALAQGEQLMPDAVGNVKSLLTRRWAALIAQTQQSDAELLERAQSFSAPPSLKVSGGRVGFPSYSSERRSLRLIVESPSIDIELKPTQRTVDPVFELDGAPQTIRSVALDGRTLRADEFAWDGATLWMKASIGPRGASIALRFQ